MAKYVAGIDLGTCYSCIAYMDETGRPVVLKNMEGDATTPSVVNFASPTEVVVGQNAKDNAVIDPGNTVLLVKTLMGKEGAVAITYDGKDRSPEEVSSYILRKVVGDASKMLGEEITDVVITCPAYFGDAERTATKHAGEIAGLNVMEIISEPTAAAFYYGVTKSADPQTVLVYDLGGGTFDVTVLKITEDTIEVVCSDGDHDLGGKNWDELVMKYLAEEFKTATGYEEEFDEYARQSLAISAEKAKWQLSSREAIPVVLDIAGLRCRIEFTREKFDKLTCTYLQNTIDLTRKCMELAESKGEKIDQILLVGGSTKMPQVSRAIEEAFGISTRPLEPDEAVAKGAAIYAFEAYVNRKPDPNPTPGEEKEKLAGQDKILATLGGAGSKKIVSATTKSYAVEAFQGDKKCCCNLIKKNQAMPDGTLSGSRLFGVHEDGQITVDLVVYESDIMDEFFELNPENVLGTAVLQLPTDENGRGILSAMSPIEVTLVLNQEGILTVKGVDKTNGAEVEVTMEAKGVMSAAEVEKLKSDSHDIDIF